MRPPDNGLKTGTGCYACAENVSLCIENALPACKTRSPAQAARLPDARMPRTHP